MVNIAPFTALRYRNGSSDLSRLICPPYDVISEREQQEFAGLDACNFVRVELPLGDPALRAESAAQMLACWRQEGILKRDASPAFYMLESVFRVPGSEKTTTRFGFFCALGLEAPGRGSIHPHERTLPKPKAERLKMLEALKVNTSPIFGFFLDPKREWLKIAGRWMEEPPTVTARETSGVEHRLWVITDPKKIRLLSDLLRDKELFIADGHHRYEVGWAYHQANAQARESSRILAYLCAMEDPGLVLLPIHRYIKSPLPQNEWNVRIKKYFDVRPEASFEALSNSLEKKEDPKKGSRLGLFSWGQYYLLQLKETIDKGHLTSFYPPELQDLESVVLEAFLAPETKDLLAHPGWEIRFTHNAGELVSWVKEDSGSLAFFLPSPRIEQVAGVARTGQVMPPKTTFFYPKAPAGFVIYELA